MSGIHGPEALPVEDGVALYPLQSQEAGGSESYLVFRMDAVTDTAITGFFLHCLCLSKSIAECIEAEAGRRSACFHYNA